jgi:hypothetical protein
MRRHPIAVTFVLALLLAGSPKTSFASQGEGGGSHAGNGGDVIYCANPLSGQKRIELLDLFESRVLRENALALGGEGWDYKRRITYVLDRLKRLDPYRAGIYAENASHFLDESEFTTDELPDIPDSLHIVLPKGCVIRQIVIQRTWVWTGAKRFVINKQLWEMLDDENRAALVLHETIYREALSLQQTNSINTRLFNGTLTSKAFETMRMEAYIALLKSVAFKPYRVELGDDNWFNLPDHNGCDGYFDCDYEEAHIFGATIHGQPNYKVVDDRVLLTGFTSIHDLHSGHHSIYDPVREDSFPWPVDGQSNQQIVRFQSVSLDKDLRVLRGKLAQTLRRKSAHYDLSCESYSTLSFNDTKADEICQLYENTSINMAEVQGRQVRIVPLGKKDSYGLTKDYVTIDSQFDRVTEARFFQPEQFSIRSHVLTFQWEYSTYEDGKIRTGSLAEPGELQIPNSSKTIRASKQSHIEFFKDGSVASANLDEGALLKKIGGGYGYFGSGTWVQFNDQGEAKRIGDY